MTAVLRKGRGNERPKPHDKVRIHYAGWASDGKLVGSSLDMSGPAEFTVFGLFAGWREGVELMATGEKRRLWIPADLAFGEDPKRKGAPAGPLVYDVELVEIVEGPKLLDAPIDVKAPPANSTKTKSGLAYRVLRAGHGRRPEKHDVVVLHYSGWTPDGQLFDSSVMRDKPTMIRLSQALDGWTEGVQLMKEHEKTRFWIPPELAFGTESSSPRAPAGQVVYDIELLRIRRPAD